MQKKQMCKDSKTQRCKKRKDEKMRDGSDSCHPAFFLYIIL